ncbi:MAG TPA: MBL fold metallo-hydrolase [Ktedonobacteraceae bacterium]|nr:MBL fold metallo-hydrolase [Ktedonobacteraceae bacterium]
MLTIDVETLRTWLAEGRGVTILDVRPTPERVEWAIPGSIHVDAYDALQAHEPGALAQVDLPKDVPVVTVCGAGKTSLIAAELLQARGNQVYSLDGGMKAWSLAWNTAEVPVAGDSVRVIQVRRTGKGCLSYLIGAGEEAIVIDASLDPRIYLDLAAQYGWQITSVFDTHIHADHLSRSNQLARQSGAMLLLPEQQRVSFPFTAMRDGDTLTTPTLTLTALHTPGHTDESTCYLLNQHLLFTGDTLFTTSIGRPDLEADEEQARVRASSLYRSLHKLLALPSETLVLPGHTSTPVPFDGRPIAATLGEIDEAVEIIHAPRDLFLQRITQHLPPTPPNYHRIVRLNEMGKLPESDVTELEAGANRCAIS